MNRARPRLARSLAVGLSSLAPLLFGACGGDQPAKGPGGVPVEVRSTEVTHEPCETGAKVEGTDTNGDGKPDIRRIYGSNGREIRRVTDLNHNGKPDLFQYFDEQGNVRRREADYDESGVVDAIEYYQAGKLVRVEYDTLARHRLDTWDFFDPATGKRVRRERDSKGSGHIDQWWTWEGDKVSVAFDRNGDGQPDPSDVLAIGETNAKAVAEAGPPPSTASQVGSLDGGSAAPVAQPTATPPPLAPLPDAGAPKKAPKSDTKPKGKK